MLWLSIPPAIEPSAVNASLLWPPLIDADAPVAKFSVPPEIDSIPELPQPLFSLPPGPVRFSHPPVTVLMGSFAWLSSPPETDCIPVVKD